MDAPQSDSARRMAEHSIVRGGRYYFYDGYRYERLADAIAYAELAQARQSYRPVPSPFAQLESLDSLTEFDRQLMIELSISFENGSFVFEGFRYDRLLDAANYARYRRLSVAGP
jgi:hypothetical protein